VRESKGIYSYYVINEGFMVKYLNLAIDDDLFEAMLRKKKDLTWIEFFKEIAGVKK
jgi:hypothetical protein